jgi:hypothetical protein
VEEWNMDELYEIGEQLSDLDSLRLQIKQRGFKILRDEEGFILTTGHRTNVVLVPEDPEKLLTCARAALIQERKARGGP